MRGCVVTDGGTRRPARRAVRSLGTAAIPNRRVIAEVRGFRSDDALILPGSAARFGLRMPPRPRPRLQPYPAGRAA